jgi:hypothetical protein
VQANPGQRQTGPPCPACARPLRRPRVLCVCGHPVTSHEISRAGKRTWCCHYAPGGPVRLPGVHRGYASRGRILKVVLTPDQEEVITVAWRDE